MLPSSEFLYIYITTIIYPPHAHTKTKIFIFLTLMSIENKIYKEIKSILKTILNDVVKRPFAISFYWVGNMIE